VKRLVLGRLALVPLILFFVATGSFLLINLAPGSYADTIGASRLDPHAREMMRTHYGLDRPLSERYLHWLDAVVHADLGISFLYRAPVSRVISDSLFPTLLLMGAALTIDFCLGVLVAVLSVWREGKAVDHFLSFLSLGIYSMPSFWVAGLAVLVFSLRLGWLPASHMLDPGAPASGPEFWSGLLRHIILPAGILGLIGAASTARYLRAELLEIQNGPYLLAARARGVPAWRILLFHSLRPALAPLLTLLGLALPALVSGSVVIETIFSWPGMGRVLWQAATARDVPLVMGCVLLGALAVIIGNLVADLLYVVVDPRAR